MLLLDSTGIKSEEIHVMSVLFNVEKLVPGSLLFFFSQIAYWVIKG